MRRTAGFSLIELVIVVAILLVLASIAVPRLLDAEQQAYEATAATFLRHVQAAQETYRLANQEYADRFQLLTEVGQELAEAGAGRGGTAEDVVVYSSYIFRLGRPAPDQWWCTAEPVRGRARNKYFFLNETGTLRMELGKPANAASPPAIPGV